MITSKTIFSITIIIISSTPSFANGTHPESNSSQKCCLEQIMEHHILPILEKLNQSIAYEPEHRNDLFDSIKKLLEKSDKQIEVNKDVLDQIRSAVQLMQENINNEGSLYKPSWIIPAILALIGIYLAAKVYTATNSPWIMTPVNIPNVSKLYHHYIDPKGKKVTYESLVFEMIGSNPAKNIIYVLRDVVAGGIRIRKIGDVKEAFEVGKAQGSKLDVSGESIIGPVSIEDIKSMQSDSIVIHSYNDTEEYFLVEIKLGFKHRNPLWIILENKDEKMSSWKISGKQIVHEYRI